ncbi:hypothetical protein [Streptomyces sp. NPDC054783]
MFRGLQKPAAEEDEQVGVHEVHQDAGGGADVLRRFLSSAAACVLPERHLATSVVHFGDPGW